VIAVLKIVGIVLPMVAAVVAAVVAAPEIKRVREQTGDDSLLTYILSGSFLKLHAK